MAGIFQNCNLISLRSDDPKAAAPAIFKSAKNIKKEKRDIYYNSTSYVLLVLFFVLNRHRQLRECFLMSHIVLKFLARYKAVSG
jgi:hypothetical protein